MRILWPWSSSALAIPVGIFFTYQHLAKVAETAKKLGIMIIADEVYGHLTFGSNPFVPMGVFVKTTPILTVGSISKKWLVPGWRMGWLVMCDPKGIALGIENYLSISTDPATFIQAVVPNILENTEDKFFSKTISILRQAADIYYAKLEEINCITYPHKSEGSMFVMVELSLSYLDDILDDVDFCYKACQGGVSYSTSWECIGFEELAPHYVCHRPIFPRRWAW